MIGLKQHEWEQIDQGEGYCLDCGATNTAVECMSTPEQKQSAPKPQERGKVSHGSKHQEIENIKRLLANISQRIDKLK